MPIAHKDLHVLKPYFNPRTYDEIVKALVETSTHKHASLPIDQVSIVLDTITHDIDDSARHRDCHIKTDCSQSRESLESFLAICSACFSPRYMARKRTCFEDYKRFGNVNNVLDMFIASQPLSYWLKCMITEILVKHLLSFQGNVGVKSPLCSSPTLCKKAALPVEHIELRGNNLQEAWYQYCADHPRSDLVPRSSLNHKPTSLEAIPHPGDLVVPSDSPVFLGTAATERALDTIQARDLAEVGQFRTLCPTNATHTYFHAVPPLLWAFFKNDLTRAEIPVQWAELRGDDVAHEGMIVQIRGNPPAALGYAHYTLSVKQVEEWSLASRLVRVPAHGNAWKMPEFSSLRCNRHSQESDDSLSPQTSDIKEVLPSQNSLHQMSPTRVSPDAISPTYQSEFATWPEVMHAPELPEMRDVLKDFNVPQPMWRTAHCSTTSCTYLAHSIEKIYMVSFKRTVPRKAFLEGLLSYLSCCRLFSGGTSSRSDPRASVATTTSSGSVNTREKSSIVR